MKKEEKFCAGFLITTTSIMYRPSCKFRTICIFGVTTSFFIVFYSTSIFSIFRRQEACVEDAVPFTQINAGYVLPPNTNLQHVYQVLRRFKEITTNSSELRDIETAMDTMRNALASKYNDDVCPEIYSRFGDVSPKFEMDASCSASGKLSVEKLLTLMFNFQTLRPENLTQFMEDIRSWYPNIQIIITVSDADSFLKLESLSKIQVIQSKNQNPGALWNSMIGYVNTQFVYLGRGVVEIDDNTAFDRLLREITSIGAKVMGGALRTVHDGRWDLNCYQMLHSNFSLIFREGYHHSVHDCIYCSYFNGPLVSETSYLRKVSFDDAFRSEDMTFHDLFFRLYQDRVSTAVCPDSMHHMHRNVTNPFMRNDWLPFVSKWKVNNVKDTFQTNFAFTCKESSTIFTKFQPGITIAPCLLQNLADHVKFIMKICRDSNLICHLNAGTLLGALKFGTILPWERDADVFFPRENHTAIRSLKSQFENAGYDLREHQTPVPHFRSHDTAGWAIDVWPLKLYKFDRLTRKGESTMLPLDGEWVEVKDFLFFTPKIVCMKSLKTM